MTLKAEQRGTISPNFTKQIFPFFHSGTTYYYHLYVNIINHFTAKHRLGNRLNFRDYFNFKYHELNCLKSV